MRVMAYCIEEINWATLSPTYPYRFYGQGYIYCVVCECFIRVVRSGPSGVFCSGCGHTLAASPSSNQRD